MFNSSASLNCTEPANRTGPDGQTENIPKENVQAAINKAIADDTILFIEYL